MSCLVFPACRLDQACSDAFVRTNNLTGCLHSRSFHTSLYYLQEQLQHCTVVCYCILYRVRACARLENVAFTSVPFQTSRGSL